MLAELFAVIGCQHNKRLVQTPVFLQTGYEVLDRWIHLEDLPVVLIS